MRHVIFSGEGLYFKDGDIFGKFSQPIFDILNSEFSVKIDEMPSKVRSVAALTNQSLVQ